MSRRESVGRLSARTQSSSGPPSQEMVSVAVLPPRLPSGMAPPTGVGAADAFDWDESLNWRHNEPIKNDEKVSQKKSFLRKAGITTQRKPIDDSVPPFILRQVPYDVWRKHYAKDKDGNYRGTHAPAEDCLLKPHDVEKWRLGEAVTKADKWTRGSEALPVYAEVKNTAAAPEYEVEYDGPPRDDRVASISSGDLTMTADDDRLASRVEKADQASQQRLASSTAALPMQIASSRPTIADGKTAQEIIAEKEAKGRRKLTWKEKLTKGIEMVSMGS